MKANVAIAALAAVAGLTVAGACRQQPDVDRMPVGADVQVTRQDGALVEGTLKAKDDVAVKVDTGRVTRDVPRTEIADIRLKDLSKPEAVPAKARFREFVVPATANLAIRLDTAVSSKTSAEESAVRGELTAPVMIDGVSVIPAGSAVRGVVTHAQPSGKVKGVASLGVAFDTLTAGDETYRIDARFTRTAATTKKADAEKIAIPAAGGAVIGAVVGGKKGAAIGAAAGGGAGTAVVLTTAGKEVVLPVGTTLTLDAGRSFVVQIPVR